MLSVIFENEFFLILDKPAGSLSVPSREGGADVRPCVLHEIRRLRNINPLPVHRLDFEVSGLLLFALNKDAHRESNAWFEEKTIIKTYEALTENPTAFSEQLGQELTWKSLLLRGKKRAYEKPFGKESITVAKPLESMSFLGSSVLRWYLQPLTGRSHQLRFELSKHQCPILGDSLYGSKNRLADGAIALRAIKLDFSNLETREKWKLPLTIEATGLLEKLSSKHHA